MTSRPGLVVGLLALGFGLAAGEAAAGPTTIARWDFGKVQAAPDNSPAPDVGSGVAKVLGMDNNYTFSGNDTITGTGTFTYTGPTSTGSVASADVVATAGDPNGFANTWRARGPSNTLGDPQGNGWALQAPQYTQGAEFDASTAKFTNVQFHFDWFCTTQGVDRLQEQYTLNGTTWININGPLSAVSNAFAAPQTIDFSGIAGVNGDANFGVRLASVYDTSLPILNYGSAAGGYYNNNSGNWRFADVGFTGTPAVATPEPSSLLLAPIAGGIVAALARARARRA